MGRSVRLFRTLDWMMARNTLHSSIIIGLSTAALGLAAPAGARAGNVIELSYVVDIAGATVLKAQYRANIGDDRYEASLSGKTSGMSTVFSSYKMELSANGKVEAGGFRSSCTKTTERSPARRRSRPTSSGSPTEPSPSTRTVTMTLCLPKSQPSSETPRMIH